jgi:3-hydroxybutyryl-CoA dehydratase
MSNTNTFVKFGDIKLESIIPTLTKEITLEQFAMYSAVCWDFHPMHYDSQTGQDLGFRTAFADGPMLAAFLGQVATEWLGSQSKIKRLKTRYLKPVFPQDTLYCSGSVLNKFDDGEPSIECEVWANNQDGKRVASGIVIACPPQA